MCVCVWGGDGQASGLEGVVGTQDSVGNCWKDTRRRGRQPGVWSLTGAWEARGRAREQPGGLEAGSGKERKGRGRADRKTGSPGILEQLGSC